MLREKLRENKFRIERICWLKSLLFFVVFYKLITITLWIDAVKTNNLFEIYKIKFSRFGTSVESFIEFYWQPYFNTPPCFVPFLASK